MVIVLISKIKQINGTSKLISNILLNKVVKLIGDETTKQAQCKHAPIYNIIILFMYFYVYTSKN